MGWQRLKIGVFIASSRGDFVLLLDILGWKGGIEDEEDSASPTFIECLSPLRQANYFDVPD